MEVWGVYAGLVLRDENFALHLVASVEPMGDYGGVEPMDELKGIEEKTCLRDGAWLANARSQVGCEQLERKPITEQTIIKK